MALFGFANAYVDGISDLVACLVCLFVNGIGVSELIWWGGTDKHLTLGVFLGLEKTQYPAAD